MTLNSNGSCTYLSNAGYTGPDGFTYYCTADGTASQAVTDYFNVTDDAPSLNSANGGSQTSAAEEAADLGTPGEVVPTDNPDNAVNSHGVPGFADGYGTFGDDYEDEQWNFVPFTLTLPAGFNTSTGEVSIQYYGSDPTQVTRTGSGTTANPYQYSLPTGPNVAPCEYGQPTRCGTRPALPRPRLATTCPATGARLSFSMPAISNFSTA